HGAPARSRRLCRGRSQGHQRRRAQRAGRAAATHRALCQLRARVCGFDRRVSGHGPRTHGQGVSHARQADAEGAGIVFCDQPSVFPDGTDETRWKMNTAVTTLRTIRNERLPEDSGEWRPVPLNFRFLRDRTPSPDRRHLARLILATLVVVGVHGLVIWAATSHWAVFLVAAFVGPAPGVAAGLLWLAQFEPLRRKQAYRIATGWLVLLAVPALALVVWCGVCAGIDGAMIAALVAMVSMLI